MSAEVVTVPEPRSYGEQVAEEVRATAARKRVTSARLAAAVHVSHASMSRRMNGRYPFTVDELAAVAEVLGVTVRELLPEWAPRGSNPKPTGSRRGLVLVSAA